MNGMLFAAFTSREKGAADRPHGLRGWPATLVVGIAVILCAEALLGLDVALRGGAVAPYETLGMPRNWLQSVSRWIAVNMTPLCWVGFLLFADGMLTMLAGNGSSARRSSGSPFRQRTRRAVACFLASVPIWLYFDWVNFSYIDAWRYHGLPENDLQRYLGYFIAFGAIFPGMFLTAELYLQLGLQRCRTRGLSLGRAVQVTMFCFGCAFVGFPFIARDPVANLTLWLGPILFLDPVNHWIGAPSIISDLKAGRWGRTLALMGGGLTCGLLWEFWNYWAAAKWTYNLPFLGVLEQYRYFEMPWIGLLGFLPFGIACWVAFQSMVIIIERLLVLPLGPNPAEDVIL